MRLTNSAHRVHRITAFSLIPSFQSHPAYIFEMHGFEGRSQSNVVREGERDANKTLG